MPWLSEPRALSTRVLPGVLPGILTAPVNVLVKLVTVLVILALVVVVAPVVVAGTSAVARAAEPGPVGELRLEGVGAAAGRTGQLRIEVLAPPPRPMALVVQRGDGTSGQGDPWREVLRVPPDAAGVSSSGTVVELLMDRQPDRNRVRARFEEADGSGGATGWVESEVPLVALDSVLTVEAPATVVDESSIVLRARWRASDTTPVSGQVVLERSVLRAGRWTAWTAFRTLSTDVVGEAQLTVRPRWSHRWRLVAADQPWVRGGVSPVRTTKNLPGAKPVVMPRGAPRPRITLPPQRRAVGRGASVEVSRITAAQWRRMRGVSWRPGCPVGRSRLRVVETNYWAFDGYRRRGQVVVEAGVVSNFAGAFRALHAARVPIRSLRPVEYFGRSAKLRGGDDLRSMASDNSSAFNCRAVVGQPGRLSPHAGGRAFDLNPWENPFRSAWGTVPNRWWVARSHRHVAWRSREHRVVALMARHGFRWTYGASDLHHFDAVPRRS